MRHKLKSYFLFIFYILSIHYFFHCSSAPGSWLTGQTGRASVFSKRDGLYVPINSFTFSRGQGTPSKMVELFQRHKKLKNKKKTSEYSFVKYVPSEKSEAPVNSFPSQETSKQNANSQDNHQGGSQNKEQNIGIQIPQKNTNEYEISSKNPNRSSTQLDAKKGVNNSEKNTKLDLTSDEYVPYTFYFNTFKKNTSSVNPQISLDNPSKGDLLNDIYNVICNYLTNGKKIFGSDNIYQSHQLDYPTLANKIGNNTRIEGPILYVPVYEKERLEKLDSVKKSVHPSYLSPRVANMKSNIPHTLDYYGFIKGKRRLRKYEINNIKSDSNNSKHTDLQNSNIIWIFTTKRYNYSEFYPTTPVPSSILEDFQISSSLNDQNTPTTEMPQRSSEYIETTLSYSTKETTSISTISQGSTLKFKPDLVTQNTADNQSNEINEFNETESHTFSTFGIRYEAKQETEEPISNETTKPFTEDNYIQTTPLEQPNYQTTATPNPLVQINVWNYINGHLQVAGSKFFPLSVVQLFNKHKIHLHKNHSDNSNSQLHILNGTHVAQDSVFAMPFSASTGTITHPALFHFSKPASGSIPQRNDEKGTSSDNILETNLYNFVLSYMSNENTSDLTSPIMQNENTETIGNDAVSPISLTSQLSKMEKDTYNTDKPAIPQTTQKPKNESQNYDKIVKQSANFDEAQEYTKMILKPESIKDKKKPTDSNTTELPDLYFLVEDNDSPSKVIFVADPKRVLETDHAAEQSNIEKSQPNPSNHPEVIPHGTLPSTTQISLNNPRTKALVLEYLRRVTEFSKHIQGSQASDPEVKNIIEVIALHSVLSYYSQKEENEHNKSTDTQKIPQNNYISIKKDQLDSWKIYSDSISNENGSTKPTNHYDTHSNFLRKIYSFYGSIQKLKQNQEDIQKQEVSLTSVPSYASPSGIRDQIPTKVNTNMDKKQTYTTNPNTNMVKQSATEFSKILSEFVPPGTTFRGCLENPSCAFVLAACIAVGATLPLVYHSSERHGRKLYQMDYILFNEKALHQDAVESFHLLLNYLKRYDKSILTGTWNLNQQKSMIDGIESSLDQIVNLDQ